MKNRVKTKWLVMLFSVAMAACLMVVPSFAAEIVDSGICGDDLTWELSSDGVITINGSGDMYDYDERAPWYDYGESITELVIEEGVTSIGDWAFYDCNLVSVSMADSVTSIGEYAFNYCSSLEEITLSDSLDSIGEGAFNRCISLKSISIPEGVTILVEATFHHCDSLESIDLPDSLEIIEDYVFGYCYELKSLTIPEKVISIGDCAFIGCESLSEIYFEGDAPEFADRVFASGTDGSEVTPVVYYPAGNDTWTEDIMLDYEGSPTWVPYWLTGYETCEKDGSCLISEFTDLDETAWYHDGVHFCIENDLMNGTSSTTFEPSTATTRSMIVTMLYRLAGKPEVEGTSSFSDVASGSWYEDAVIWAEQNGIANGYGTGEFGVSDEVTREQIAAFFCRYAEYAGEDVTESADLSSYPDADEVSDWAQTELSWAVAKGLITGQGSGSATYLASGSDAMRSETATILMRFIINIIDVE